MLGLVLEDKVSDKVHASGVAALRTNAVVQRTNLAQAKLPELTSIEILEAQASFILSETRANLQNVGLMFSAGKDSACLAHLMKRTFTNSEGETKIPFTFFHYDSGDNFPEVLAYRDQLAKQLGVKLVTLNIHNAYQTKLIQNQPDSKGSVAALVELINFSQKAYELDGLIGGGRRDEDAVRAKERVFSLRDTAGSWDAQNQRPELWNLYNTQLREGEHLRIFPISNWTERNVWQYIAKHNVPLPSIYYAHEREVVNKNGVLRAYFDGQKLLPSEKVETKFVRCRTAGDRSTTGFIESTANSPESVLHEIINSKFSERAGRQEDANEETSMENRKAKGWF